MMMMMMIDDDDDDDNNNNNNNNIYKRRKLIKMFKKSTATCTKKYASPLQKCRLMMPRQREKKKRLPFELTKYNAQNKPITEKEQVSLSNTYLQACTVPTELESN